MRALFARGSDEGRIVTTSVRLNGQLVAANIELYTSSGHLYSFKTAFDETYRPHALGTIAIASFLDYFYENDELKSLDSCVDDSQSNCHALFKGRREIVTVAFTNQKAGMRLLQAITAIKQLKKKLVGFFKQDLFKRDS